MLPNEIFALSCRAYYDEQGLIVDKTNGEFAHCPYPEGMGETGYYLLHEHHQQQGLLQSKDLGKCCFFSGDTKKWLRECNYWPDNYFGLWDIYEKYASLNAAKAGKAGSKVTNAEKDEDGKSINAVKAGRKRAETLNKEIDEFGRSIDALKGAEAAHREKDEKGRSVLAVNRGKKGGQSTHREKNEQGKSINAVKLGQLSKLKTQKTVELTYVLTGEVFCFPSVSDAAKNLGLNPKIISNVCRGQRRITKGYTARYL